MKSFNEYINEASQDKSSAEYRKKELEKQLKHKNYPQYVQMLNKMLEDDKNKALLIDGFGGELSDTEFEFDVIDIPVKNLIPTQAEIDVAKSIEFPLTQPKYIDDYFKDGGNKVMLADFPIITFRKNYIIDGHHRWSQVYAFNPDAKMVCCDYDAENVSPIQMLKATQGAIAAVKADDNNKNDGNIPSSVVKGQNLYDEKWNKAAIIKYIKDTAVEGVVDKMEKYNKNLNDLDKVAKYLAENLLTLKSNNYPAFGKDSPKRGDMPQTNRGGYDPEDPETALPSKEGSALNRLKDDGFYKGAAS